MTVTTGDLRGTMFGRFRIVELLGRGGMGDVYRARDESLSRDVAVKVLPPELTGNPKRVERFMQEARAASALNHPHLTTIYEIGVEPAHYIAMELVPGRTLRAVLDGGRPLLPRVLDQTLQLCDALGAAHDAGVVHRDIKPENVMVTDDGYVKLLDFGVAKLRDDDLATGDQATRVALTKVGAMVGTSGYMSPEQARGGPTDHRTDIFALGCVLYECVTGVAAFGARSAVERLHRVIHDEPRPIASRAPAELAGVVRKCLAKDPADRYQSMKDLAIDLRYLRRLLETSASVAPLLPAPRHRPRPAWTAVAAVAVTLALAVIWQRTRRPAEIPPAPVPAATVQRLTASGNTIDAEISPDGRYLAHVEAIGSRQTLWVRSLQTGEDRALMQAGAFSFYGLRFTPDSKSIAVTTRGIGFLAGRLSMVPVDGSEPRLMSSNLLTPIAYAPDGRRFAFLRERYPDQDSSALIVANADGTGERVLATRHTPEGFAPAFFTSTAWSPDGARIVTASRNTTIGRARLVEFEVQSGAEHDLYASSADITASEWLPDGSAILFISRGIGSAEAGAAPGQVWSKPYPSGTPQRLTNDLIDYRKVTISRDASTLLAVGAEYQSSLYLVPLDGGPPRRIPSERSDGLVGVLQLRDGSLIVTASIAGQTQLVRLSADGATRKVLTTAGTNTFPATAPDESVVAMVSTRDGSTGIWRMNIDGSEQRLVAPLPAAAWLSITPDARSVIAMSYVGRPSSAWRVPLDGGQPVEIARGLERAAPSPDGRWLGGIHEPPGSPPHAAVMPLDGSAPIRTLNPHMLASGTGVLTWARDSSGVIGSSNERFNLFFHGLNGQPLRPLTHLTDLAFIRGSLSVDGKSIIAARGVFNRDVFTIVRQ